MTARVAWDESVPVEVRAAAESHVARHIHRLPGWVHELRIGWDAANPDANAGNLTRPEYRWARINICPGFLNEGATDRDEIVLHEIVHVPLQGLANAAWRLVDELKGHAPAAEALARESVRVALEGAVCDVRRMLTDAISEPRPA